MQKTTTLKDFKVCMLKSFLAILVLCSSFQASFAQNTPSKAGLNSQLLIPTKSVNSRQAPVRATNNNNIQLTKWGQGVTPTNTNQPATIKVVDANMTIANPNKTVNTLPNIPSNTITKQGPLVENTNASNDVSGFVDNPVNKTKGNNKIAGKQNLIGPNGVTDVCTYTGSLVAGHSILSNGRIGRNAIASSCAAPKTCPGPLGSGPFFYDLYTLKNTTGSSQCVTISYVSDGASGDCIATAYNGCFIPTNICTNYLGDGGTSSLAGGQPLTFSVTVPDGGVLTVNMTQISAPCLHYTLIITGLPCNAIVPPTSSILSQAAGVPIPTTLLSESFDNAALPANWAQQNNSSPLGTGTYSDWFQGTTAGTFPPNSGADFRGATYLSGSGLATLSNWLMTPSVNLKNGDQFSFYTRCFIAVPERMQVRMSTNGTSTNVGTTVTDVGDFNTLLLDINPSLNPAGYPTAWTQYTVTLSGLPAAGVSGRLAFRDFVSNSGPSGTNGFMIGVDDVLYQTFSPGPVTTCSGSVANLKVDILGGNTPTYDVTIHPSVGANFTVTNYTSGNNIPVTPAVTTTYNLVSVFPSGTCLAGTGNAGTPTITVNPATIPGIIVTAAPDAPLCAGDPALLTVSFGSSTPPGVLYSQLAAIPDGYASQFFEPAFTAFNCQGGDDFIVPGGSTWTINSIVAQGLATSGGTPTSINVYFYANSGSNLPGASVATVMNITTFTGGASGNYNITLPPAGVQLSSGRYWLSVQVNMAFGAGGQWYWGTYGTTNINFQGAWQNPGGGFGLCPTWNYASTGCGIGPEHNYSFSLSGSAIVPGGSLPPGWTIYWTPAAGISNQTGNPTTASPMVTTTYTALATAPGGCQTSASKKIVVNQLPAITLQPVDTKVCDKTTAIFTAGGTATGVTYQWQVSTNNGVTYINLTNVAPYSGVNTQVLTINPVNAFLNNNRYRLAVSGVCNPTAFSYGAILTVTGLPTITITPAGPVCGGVAGLSGTLITAGASAPPVPGSVSVSSGTLNLVVPDNTPNGVNTTLNVSGIPANATVVGARVTFNMPHTYCGDMLFNLKAPNGVILALDKYLGGTGNQAGPYPNIGFVNTVISSAGVNSLGTASTQPITGTWKADLLNAALPFPITNPTGFVSTATAWSQLYPTPPNGVWTLAMCDGGPGDIGTLQNWTITIDYTTPGGAGNPVTYTWAPLAGLYNDPIATINYTGTVTNQVYASPTANTLYTVTGTDGTTGCSNTGTILVLYTPPPPTVTPNPVTMCLGDPAVLLRSSSNSSGSVSASSGNVNIPIPDGPNVPPNPPAVYPATTSSVNVAGIPAGATITNVRVTMNIPHGSVSDLVITLKAPNNNVLNLDASISQTWGAGANLTNTVISSAGSTALGAGAPPYTGTFKADAVGATFNMAGFTWPGGPGGYVPNVNNFPALYSTPNGTWTLAMYDNSSGGTGTLNNWSIAIDYTLGVAATHAVWSPEAGLFSDPAATVPYVAGTPVDSVWTRPTPAGIYTYNVNVNGFASSTATITTPAPGGNGNSMILFNITNNNLFPAVFSAIGSNTFFTGTTNTRLFYKTTGIAGPPGLIQPSNGWNQFGSGTAPTTAGVISTLVTGLNLSIPPGATYGIAVEGTLGGGFNMQYSNGTGTIKTYTNNNCTITVDGNVGWGSGIAPGPPGNNPRNFNGYVTLNVAIPSCTSPARVVTVTVNQPITITAQPVSAVVCTDKVTSFTVAAAGTSPTYQWQVSTDVGNTFTNLSNNSIYSGVTTPTLTITNPPTSYSGYIYRCAVTGAAPCGTANSKNVLLTVNPKPTIVITAAPYTKLWPGLRTAISSTVSPIVNVPNYIWLRNGSPLVQTNGVNPLGIVSGLTTGIIVLDVDGMGTYQLQVTDVNGCTNISSNSVTISDSLSGRVFLYPNPNNGRFQVRYDPIANNVLPRGINVYNTLGQRITTQYYSLGLPYARMDVDLTPFGSGVYWIEIVDVNGQRLAMGRAEVIR